jgi:hypothetical protein
LSAIDGSICAELAGNLFVFVLQFLLIDLTGSHLLVADTVGRQDDCRRLKNVYRKCSINFAVLHHASMIGKRKDPNNKSGSFAENK